MKAAFECHHLHLTGYDYAQAGAYFVTICVRGRECLLGKVIDGEMRMNTYGRIVQQVWEELPSHYPDVGLDAWIVMPNHVHGIVVLTEPDPHIMSVGAGFKPAPTGVQAKRYPLSEIVRALKTFSARRINELRGTVGRPFWQRGYYEHIIRNERELERICLYILANPARWKEDTYFRPRVPARRTK